jgi:hypothetical protein
MPGLYLGSLSTEGDIANKKPYTETKKNYADSQLNPPATRRGLLFTKWLTAAKAIG